MEQLAFEFIDEFWSLDRTVASYLLPRIVLFKNLHLGFDTSIADSDELDEILTTICTNLNILSSDKYFRLVDYYTLSQQTYTLLGEVLPLLWL